MRLVLPLYREKTLKALIKLTTKVDETKTEPVQSTEEAAKTEPVVEE